MNLKDKVALVTGAGKRVGRTIALALAERGAIARDSLPKLTRGSRGRASPKSSPPADGRRPSPPISKTSREIERMVAEVIAAFGRIDILVNCASVFYRKPIEELTEHDWDVNLDTNLKAPFFLSKFAGAAMRRNGAGKIVNIGDWAGIRPYNNYLPYTVSKSGLIGLTRALAKALAPEVQVNCVALGPVMPPDDYDAAEIETLRKATLTKTPGHAGGCRRAGFCSSARASDFATGSTLMLDGGRMLN